VRILIAAGGTGGHVYPALAAAEAILARDPSSELTFVGSVGGFERPLLEQARLPFKAIYEVQAGPIHGMNPVKTVINAGKLGMGTLQALRLIGRVRPQVVLSTGGWVSFPVAQAAWLRRKPVVIYLPDIEPGLTIKAQRAFATHVAATAPDSAAYINQKKLVVTGYPLRESLKAATRGAGIAHFGLDASKKTLLVFGGSRGAQTINTAVFGVLEALLARGDVQVIHVTGTLDWERTTPHRGRAGYFPFAYLHDDMGLALAAADLALCRSGASTLGELPYFGLPSILVPYPFAWRYQKVNADYLAERGAALVMADDRMASDLSATVSGLLDDPARLQAMAASARALAVPDAAGKIAALLESLAAGQRSGNS
jgi:UDP-N-acetylglucosamine--N-acetylmuramyl-(pentapeptide) pyrophosphoryl-undecaprenol N-acetylglucosamine transferase